MFPTDNSSSRSSIVVITYDVQQTLELQSLFCPFAEPKGCRQVDGHGRASRATTLHEPSHSLQYSAALTAGVASCRKSTLTSSTDSRRFTPAHNFANPKRPPATNWTTTSARAESSGSGLDFDCPAWSEKDMREHLMVVSEYPFVVSTPVKCALA